MRTTLKHALHEHTLILRKFSQAIPYHCSLCDRYPDPYDEPLSGEIYNQVYCCEDCNFFIHKWCAELPQQIHHPSHPQHPLSLDIENYTYRCDESSCQKSLEVVSAIATLPPEDEEKTRDTDHQLDFFGHCHPLNFFHVKIPTKIKCQVCENKIRGSSVYGCRACLFLIHESCAQLPRQIENHPLHPEHLLNLVDMNQVDLPVTSCKCKLCGMDPFDYMYICYECNVEFVLHVNCAIAYSTPPSDLVKLDHPSHAHLKLISGYLQGGHNYVKCQICSGLIKSGEVYSCTRKYTSEEYYYQRFCSFFIHKTCAELPWKPQKLRHPFFPNGDLNLIQKMEDKVERKRSCYACGTKIYHHVPYYNHDDDFNMHAGCAMETLSAILKGGATAKIQHFVDDNLFFTCYIPNPSRYGLKRKCLACRKSIERLGYFCYKRYEFIHKSCAEELKPVLDHPFHPQHPLLLQCSTEKREIFFCKGCNSDCNANYYFYSCVACGFHLDLNCALPKPTLRDPCHQHDLAYFEHIKYMRCHACGYSCSTDLYRCRECNFNVHLDCLPLPAVVKDIERHLHPLTLCDKVPDQDCDVCRIGTNPRHGAYYCEECNFVAHIECAVSKGVKRKHSQSLEKEIDFTKRSLEKHKKRIEEEMAQMQKTMAALNVLESMKIGWGETQEAFEEDSCRSSN